MTSEAAFVGVQDAAHGLLLVSRMRKTGKTLDSGPSRKHAEVDS